MPSRTPEVHSDVSNPAPFRPLPFIERAVEVERRADGSLLLRSPVAPREPARNVPGLFRAAAARRPGRTWIAQRRGADRAWRQLGYDQALAEVDALTQALLDLDAPGRPVAVLSGNSIEHGELAVAAMQAGMPLAPISPAYSLMSRDHAKLREMIGLLDPAVVFVQDGDAFGAALQALPLERAQVWAVDPLPRGLPVAVRGWDALCATPVRRDMAALVEAIEPSTVARYMFTSGSTGTPKAVTITQRMMCVATAITSQMVDWDAACEAKPDNVLLDWLPWSHVAGGVAIFNGVLDDAGTLYIDDGRPVPGLFEETLRNLREISPVRFSSMPLAYGMLADALQRDDVLARSFFRHLRRMTYSGARLPDAVHQSMQDAAVRHTGFRIPFVSAYGSTETCAAVTLLYWPSERAGLIGLPHPGVTLKLMPLDDGRHEVRVHSEAVTPGYLRQPALTAEAFDDEGFIRMGDAVSFVDPASPREGLAFAGRVAEEFKLQSGTFVRVGSLRVACVDAAAPLLADVVVAGADRTELGLLAWLKPDACRELTGQPGATLAELVTSPVLHDALRQAFADHNRRNPGSSTRIRRLLLLDQPASIDAGEINDKGYVNQRRVLERRAAAVERLFAQPADPAVILID